MKWENYLEFTLSLNFIGILGFLFLVIFETNNVENTNNNEVLYWIGFILCII